ncbi:4-hydroxy-tetrahydrodipicolinate reductase [candidate division WOR-1 bacterium RIFOXYD2_FULL_36_8]|uniref:4-hydroxy-tetrahydrodipicolinate reductase n=1 Tax=candidate division WOR-1 bacterium RIFOXYB2_FULL_36_35 TaxID=1802578 RepID=A0A1F4S137_UNCSA|nr:MAG: 4-hydroxy-tetrahydrodipicolinate reductase [candidate division WOR-1 bacterium RIFOXYA2_FULL_36_21]OGC14142.1 MAG: 4-hydroxy-tetrahydrodipicolinate reductase [candidate division WOR-1 bacterium RIFOXYB2_FULL_36_35]OGC15364.1 MAG: 4-hydroxy-tetrahydrodipicolinate reductase [candidate division WOR-1 bacterium RIFOXYA12_FULL_36_13]OGC38645.1 MAG: 4-hydroxy-tetrahydrodipicolinate reductase [candidate division WOR-1 bacterium RIFOXYD2_FULL_36_8]
MSKIKVVVNGARGKMGIETVKAVLNESDLDLVAQIDLGDDLVKAIKEKKAEVVVDFTHPKAAFQNVKNILEAGAHAVVGTTGLTINNLKNMEDFCKKTKRNCIVAPNFAIGAVLMMQFAKEAAKYMKDVEVIEFHHQHKVDKPSGTAIKTAKMIQDVIGKEREIPIHAVRLPGLVAHQEVIFGGLGQTLTIRHDTINRESFMPGVILAIRKVGDQKGLVYGLEEIL